MKGGGAACELLNLGARPFVADLNLPLAGRGAAYFTGKDPGRNTSTPHKIVPSCAAPHSGVRVGRKAPRRLNGCRGAIFLMMNAECRVQNAE